MPLGLFSEVLSWMSDTSTLGLSNERYADRDVMTIRILTGMVPDCPLLKDLFKRPFSISHTFPSSFEYFLLHDQGSF
jgi:hypothetical protein